MATLPLSQAFTARAIGINWDKYKASLGEPPYLGRTKFGTTKQEGLSIKFIKGKNGMPVALKASNFDAQAELRDGIGFTDVQNEMPFFRESIMVTEKEEQDYASFANSDNAAYANQILAEIMKKPLDLVKGARVIPERMIWQLLAPTDGTPKVTVNLKGTTYDIDYIADADKTAFLSTNFVELTGNDKWDAPTTATPLKDLIKIKKDFAKKTGYSLARFTMNTETFELMVSAEDTKKQILGVLAYTNGMYLDDSEVVKYLKSKGILIELYDKQYIGDDGESHYFVPTGMISCQSEGVFLGNYVFGTTPEMRSGSLASGNLSIVDTGISIYTYATNHPINTHSVVSMLGLPTYEGMDSVCVVKVK